jgi:hypothetical protein
MPRATVSMEPKRIDLKSLPGGWIELRRMSYGERLHRQDLAMAMSMEADSKTKTTSLDIQATQTAVAQYELATAVVDHNLEDDTGRKLDFRNKTDFANLDGRIGEEIGDHIDEMHDWDADLPNSASRSIGSSTASDLDGARPKETPAAV